MYGARVREAYSSGWQRRSISFRFDAEHVGLDTSRAAARAKLELARQRMTPLMKSRGINERRARQSFLLISARGADKSGTIARVFKGQRRLGSGVSTEAR
jgi:hypothetical protein